MYCSEAIELITEYLMHKSLNKATLKAVLEHISNCRNCINELDSTISVITGKPFGLAKKASKFLTCSECEEFMSECIELNEKEIMEKYPRIWEHLQGCTRCHEQYTVLKGTLEEEKKGIYGTPPSGPTFGELVAAKNKVPIWKEVKKGIHCLAKELKILLGENAAKFSELPLSLKPYALSPVTMGKFREDRAEKIIQRLKLPDVDRECQITLSIAVNSKGEAEIGIEVRETKTDLPVKGAGITLYDTNHNILETDFAREDGKIGFTKLKPNRYIVQVKHLNVTWEIPLSFSATSRDKHKEE
jgi:hypothetical protein